MARKKRDKKAYISKARLISEYGMTPSLIRKFLPEPKKVPNPHYRSAPPMSLWEEDKVKEIVQTKEYQLAFQKLTEQRNKRATSTDSAAGILRDYDLDKLIERGKALDRHFVFHVGETNSGKTYHAIQAMKKAENLAVYLGPLRLLALEMFDTLNHDGYPCSLLTGEESQEVPFAKFTASTIELCDYGRHYDVAVIDEAQMIGDVGRGAHWTQAICMVDAAEVHVCMAPEALDLIKSLVERIGSTYEVQKHDRLVPLVYSGNIRGMQDIQPGDALITFSRRGVLNVAGELEDDNIKSSVIYGALPPASRREEVRRFSEKENPVVVATDAIGMGVSLPIKRVIFMETEKFDGVQRRSLNVSEIKQIAGRAGRFGKYDIGEVLVMNDSARLVESALKKKTPPISKITIPFPPEALDSKYEISTLLKEWNNLPVDPLFKRADMSTQAELYSHLSKKERGDAPKQLIFELISCPVDTKNERLVYYWHKCCSHILKGGLAPLPDYFETDTLAECETAYKAWDIYHQMQRRIGIEDPHLEEKAELCRKINSFLVKNKKQFRSRCKRCGAPLPHDFPFRICNDCYNRRYDRDDLFALW